MSETTRQGPDTVRRNKEGDDLTIGQVAAALRVTGRTASKWFDAGLMQGYRYPLSGDRRVYRWSLAEFQRAYHFHPTRPPGEPRVLLVGFADDAVAAVVAGLESSAAVVAVAPGAVAAASRAAVDPPDVVAVAGSVGSTDAAALAQTLCGRAPAPALLAVGFDALPPGYGVGADAAPDRLAAVIRSLLVARTGTPP